MELISSFTEFIKKFITEMPDIFTYLLSFLSGIIEYIKDLFASGQIIIGILIVLVLVKLVGIIRNVI